MLHAILSPLVMMAAANGTVSSPDGVRIHYETAGKGRPALLLVHCWTCDSSFWKDQVARLSRNRQVVTLDLAGHGRSGRTRKDYTMEAFGQDVKAVADELKLDRMVLVGHSMGGAVILEAAKLLGGRVVGLVPIDTLVDVEQSSDPKETDAVMAKMQADYEGQTTAFIRQYLFAPTTPPAVAERIVAQTTRFPAEIAISALRNNWNYKAAPAFDVIKVPIVAVNGDRFPTNFDANRRHAPQFDALIMKGVGHYPMLEDPARFGRLLDEALRKVGAS
ncbi:MAG TPA: alpha/beta hydrolase [Vicinamibacteria bacterium]|nr:alpha/beta hydrolase [Vicinamibacteria bacterium]